MATTFLLTLLIPLQYAVMAGVAISVVLFIVNESNKVTVTRWSLDEASPYSVEGPAPAVLPGGEVVVLTAYGSLFFASAQVVEAQLPWVVPESAGAVVVLRLRARRTWAAPSSRRCCATTWPCGMPDAACCSPGRGAGAQAAGAHRRARGAGTRQRVPATSQDGESLESALARARGLTR